ncbi:MAG TPA: DUF1801 domain-containing protein [Chryseosolibacter sp.]|nr:DUF1801 domain-containing protein [Chryseosolibacter sp.]
MQNIKATTIDEYIAAFPREVQMKLKQIRSTIRKAAPKAQEAIKYAIPAFVLDGNLVFFAAYKKHIGFYPAPRGNDGFKKLLEKYEGGKGTVKFPLDKPIPLPLITKMVKFRVKENAIRKQLKKLKLKERV